MANVLNLIEVIADKISNSTTEQEILFLSKIIEKLQLGRLKLVSSYYDMNDGISSYGELYFVESENILYYSLGFKRFPIIKNISLIFSWGGNAASQLGNLSSLSTSSPVSLSAGFEDWVDITAGASHSLAIRADGTAWGWGNNVGQLGDGTVVTRSSRVAVVGGFTDWVQVSGGSLHSLGLRSDGTVWAWGNNAYGQMGTGVVAASTSSPVSILGGFTDWTEISAGDRHSVGVRANGTAWSWGSGSYGRLGDGTVVAKSSPVSVIGGFTDWTQVSCGFQHSVGLRANGTAWAWGAGSFGRLGDGTVTNSSSPVSVVGGFTDWAQVVAGGYHNLAIKSDGTAWSWGNNSQGRLGDGTAVAKSSPVSVVGGFTDWIQVRGGTNHSMGLRANGTAWTWGNNTSGTLGDNTAVAKSSPVSVVGGFIDWIELAAGGSHSTGIRINI